MTSSTKRKRAAGEGDGSDKESTRKAAKKDDISDLLTLRRTGYLMLPEFMDVSEFPPIPGDHKTQCLWHVAGNKYHHGGPKHLTDAIRTAADHLLKPLAERLNAEFQRIGMSSVRAKPEETWLRSKPAGRKDAQTPAHVDLFYFLEEHPELVMAEVDAEVDAKVDADGDVGTTDVGVLDHATLPIYTAWLCIHAGDSSLQLFPGSHFDHGWGQMTKERQLPTDTFGGNPVALAAKPGDLVIFNVKTTHASVMGGKDGESATRCSMDMRCWANRNPDEMKRMAALKKAVMERVTCLAESAEARLEKHSKTAFYRSELVNHVFLWAVVKRMMPDDRNLQRPIDAMIARLKTFSTDAHDVSLSTEPNLPKTPKRSETL